MSDVALIDVLSELRAIRELLERSADDMPRAMFIDDVAAAIGTSRRSIEMARRARAFPIPEIDGIDSRPRWSSDVVRKFMNGELKATRPDKRGRFAVVKKAS